MTELANQRRIHEVTVDSATKLGRDPAHLSICLTPDSLNRAKRACQLLTCLVQRLVNKKKGGTTIPPSGIYLTTVICRKRVESRSFFGGGLTRLIGQRMRESNCLPTHMPRIITIKRPVQRWFSALALGPTGLKRRYYRAFQRSSAYRNWDAARYPPRP